MQHLDIGAKAREYAVEVAWSDEDQRFIATMPEWGSSVIDGNTEEGALKRAREAIESNIERLLQHGRTLPKPHHVA